MNTNKVEGLNRRDLCIAGFFSACGARIARADDGFRSLFDGHTLRGWTPKVRDPAHPSLGKWVVEDGIIIGGQDPPGSGLGAYLVSDEAYGDFELQIEARPDWPADTGILVRTTPQGNTGYQVLLDHRPHGGIGGFFGNNLGGFHAWNYGFTGELDANGKLVRLVPEKPNEPNALYNVDLDFAAPPETFLKIWKIGGWNHFRIRCVGDLPKLTTWINGEKIAEMDLAKMKVARWEPQKVLETLGTKGHIALEVHSNGGSDKLGKDRWAPGAVCRWRNISIKTL
jgi:hypothetical protein